MKSFLLTTLLTLSLFVPTALASDDGQTQPRLDYGAVIFPNTSTDLISTTNGTGNIKGIQCRFVNGVQGTINIFVNGGSAQALTLKGSSFPVDVNGENFSGWIPFNVRFTSSIRVQLQKGSATGQISCAVSWGLD